MKIKIFYHDSCKVFAQFEDDINLWLKDNSDIEVVSTNRTSNSYSILYKTKDNINGPDEVD